MLSYISFHTHCIIYLLALCFQALCTLTGDQAYAGLAKDFGIVPASRWDSVYVLLGMCGFWWLVYMTILLVRIHLHWRAW